MSEIIANTVYFRKPGKENTARVLELAYVRAAELGINTVVVASTSGETAAVAAERFTGSLVIAVTHSTGFGGPNEQELKSKNRDRIEAANGVVLTTTHAFGGVNRSIRKKLNTYQVDEIIAYTLRIFGEGMKVVAEISLMAADAGLLRVDEPALLIAGTGRGADTAIIALPTHAQTFFDLKILEIICMPAAKHPKLSEGS